MSIDAARARRIAELGFDASAVEAEPVEPCNLCGGTHHLEVARRDRYGFSVRFVVCARCGLGFLSPRPAPAYADFYRRIYRPLVSAYHGRQIDAETVQEEQQAYAADLLSCLRLTLPAPPRASSTSAARPAWSARPCETRSVRP